MKFCLFVATSIGGREREKTKIRLKKSKRRKEDWNENPKTFVAQE